MMLQLHISAWTALLLLLQLPSSTAKAVHFGRGEVSPAAHEVLIARQASSPPSPTNYAPFLSACPSATASGGSSVGQVRDASSQTLGSDEAAWIKKHQSATQQAWKNWLKTAAPGPNLDGTGGLKGGVDSYLNNVDNLPKVGIALSGGSFRATFFGAGFLQGLDGRNDTANARGTGGFLQLVSYVAGLSGGSWAVGSLAMNDWSTVQTLHDQVWALDAGILAPPSGSDATTFAKATIADVNQKSAAGAQVSLIDPWGRQLSAHLLNSTYANSGETAQWTDIVKTEAFSSATYPFPLVTTLSLQNGSPGSNGNGTIIEHNPFETGSYDANVAAFVPTSIFGTPLNNGASQATNSQCVYGISNAGYVLGLSSAIFNQASAGLSQTVSAIVVGLFSSIAGTLTTQISNPLVQIFNPFKGYKTGPLSGSGNITLVDGGEDGQTVPLSSLLQPARGLDFIIALDSNADTNTSWPAGYSLQATQTRYTQMSGTFGALPYPKIPSLQTIVDNGLNTRPTFFGCNSNDVNNADKGTSPIIAYIANYPWTTISNYSTTTLSFTNNVSQAALDNGVAAATLGGAQYWSTCLACASLQRSFERSKTKPPSVCTQCLDLYCYSSSANGSQTINTPYAPSVGTPAWVTQNASKIDPSANVNAAQSVFGHPGSLLCLVLLSAIATVIL